MSQPDVPPDFSQAFQDAVVVASTDEVDGEDNDQDGDVVDEDERYTLHVRTLGELVVTSGRLVACDPLAIPRMSPFADPVSPGRYPVVLSIAELASGDRRVAFALLRLSDRPAERWETAVPQGKSLRDLTPGAIFSYPVDTGTGCFMDADAARVLQARAQAAARQATDDELVDTLLKASVPTWSWANLALDEATGANVIAFSSGWGDGWYPCYWGYDASGQRVALVTDFGVLDPSWLER